MTGIVNSTGARSGIIGTTVGTPAGGVMLQCLSTTKTDVFESATTSYADISGLNVSITPASTSNKILVIANVYVSCGDAGILRLIRGSTHIGGGTSAADADDAGFAMFRETATNLGRTYSINHLDSPSSTSAVTYKIMLITEGVQASINRRAAGDAYRLSSQITVIEVAG